MRPLTEAERDAFARWHAEMGCPYIEEAMDAFTLANLASELFLADHFERITPERLREIGFFLSGPDTLSLTKESDRLECHRDISGWWINGDRIPRRLEPRYMGQVHDIMFQLWGQPQ